MFKRFSLVGFLMFSAIFSAQKVENFKLKPYRITVLNDSIKETSGLSFFENKLYTFNDSGNPSQLYEIDKNSGKILQTLKIKAENKDWEALTNDGKNFYIGDFGNNAGTREDLKILKIPFENFQLKNDSLQTISFYYPEQKDFTPKNLSTDFDLEAMLYLNGKLHLFTKEWASKSTTHYILDSNNFDKQAAEKVETFDTGFVVTDSYYFYKKLYLVGYTKKTEVYLMIFNESEPGIFFKQTPRKLYLGSALTVGQIEGIAVDESGIYISGEAFHSPIKNTPAYLYFVPANALQ